jgi:hypothetical protein
VPLPNRREIVQRRSSVPADARNESLRGVGESVYIDATDELGVDEQARLAVLAEELRGKLQTIEICGAISPRIWSERQDRRTCLNREYAACRQVADLLIAQGVEPQRLEITLTDPTACDDDRLLREQRDVRVEVLLTNRYATKASP